MNPGGRRFRVSRSESRLLKRFVDSLSEREISRIARSFWCGMTRVSPEGVSRVEYVRRLLRGEPAGSLRPEGVGDPDRWLSSFSRLLSGAASLLRERLGQEYSPALIALLRLTLWEAGSLLKEYYLGLGMGNDTRYRTILDAVYDGVVVVDTDSRRVVDLNDRMLRLLSARREDVVGKDVLLFYPEELRSIMEHKCRKYLEKGKGIVEIVHVENRETGEWIPVEISLGSYTLEGKRYAVAVFRDMRERLKHEMELSRLNRLYSVLSGVNSLITSVGDRDLLFRRAVEVVRDRGGFKYAGIYRKEEESALAEKGIYVEWDTAVCLSFEENGSGYYLLVSKYEDEEFTEEEAKLLGEIVHDLSFGLKKISFEREISHLTFYDQLTGLPNRPYFTRRLEEAINAAKAKKEEVGLLLIDIDRFGEINQALGHLAGDRVLKEVADRIQGVVRGSDFLARTGGDEFGIIVNSEDARNAIEKLIERIRERLGEPLEVDSQDIFVTLSFGASVFPRDVESAKILMTNALASVKRAKELGGNRLVMYSEGIAKATEEKIKLRTDLRRAYEREEFLLYYQPKVELGSGRVVGVEALLRWKRDGRIVPPTLFIHHLEESELIHDVGLWVVRKACLQMEEWRKKGLDLPVAVNVSPIQLKVPSFVEDLFHILSGCDRSGLEIEITESAIMEDVARSVEILGTLASYGIRVYIDDFGTGYSSLAYLKKLPVYALKIDREFIKDLPADRDSMEIVKATVLLARTFGLKTVGEGAENAEQIRLLKDVGCDCVQGYYFSPPLPPEEVERFVEDHPTTS